MTHMDSDRYDAVVVGGGVIGLACAWRAARRGLKVAVLDREAVSGATRVAAGMLAPVGEASWGEENLLRLNLESASMWPRFAAELEAESGMAVAYDRLGALHVALDRDEVDQLRHRFRLHEKLGLEAEWLRPARCRELEPGLSTACAAGVLVAGEAAVDPRALAAALVAALASAGVRIERAEATSVETEGGALSGVVCSDGRFFRGRAVILATGCWSGTAEWLPAQARPAVRPIKGEILSLRPVAPICERIVASEHVYIVPRADGRLIVGATVEDRGFDAAVTAGGVHELLREAYRAFPDVTEAELVETRAGLRPGTPDNAPLIGPGAREGLVVATGHYRNGVLLAPVTADAVGSLLVGEAPPVDLSPFDPTRFPAPADLREVMTA